MEKECGTCHKILDIECFNNKGKGKKQSKCRECQRKYVRSHYLKNKKVYLDKNTMRRKEIKVFIESFKSDGCARCDEKDPCCLDFHHMDSSQKEINIGEISHRCWSHKRTKEEIQKCIVLCSNCHRKLHNKIKNQMDA